MDAVRLVAVIAMMVVGCGGAAEAPASAEAREVVAVDAGQDAQEDAGPPWCAPLNDVQARCHIDPSAACEAHNGTRPTSAYACGAWADPPGCVGFTPDNCTWVAFCCD